MAKIEIRINAYERSTFKTKLSQFENDPKFVDDNQLQQGLDELKEWVSEHFAAASGGVSAGDINGGCIKDRLDPEVIVRKLDCRDVLDRPTSNIRYYVYGTSAKARA